MRRVLESVWKRATERVSCGAAKTRIGAFLNRLLAVVIGGAFVAQAAHADGTPGVEMTVAANSPVLVATLPLVPQAERLDLTPGPHARDPFNRFKGIIRHRFGSQMVDLYPVFGTRFHFAVGTRFFKTSNVHGDESKLTNGLLYVARMPGGGYGGYGFRRTTEAATVGYSMMVGSSMMVGIEGGSLLGRVVQAMPEGRLLSGVPGGDRRGESNRRLNPVLNVTLGYAF